mmetsp:Transcript_268/g.923  ORF Transcript_268/g.923 Transcript_268/m.923 type:complete len:313 (+) Transcript_268:34-972(+)
MIKNSPNKSAHSKPTTRGVLVLDCLRLVASVNDVWIRTGIGHGNPARGPQLARRERRAVIPAQFRRLAQRVFNLHHRPRIPGNLPFDVHQILVGIYFIHPHALYGSIAPTHASSHLFTFKHPSRVLTLPDRPVRAMLLRIPMTRGLPRKPPAFHRTLKPFPFGHPRNIHVLPSDEMRRGYRLSHVQRAVGAHAKLRERALNPNPLLHKVPKLSLGDLFRFLTPVSNLHRVVPMFLGGFHRHDFARVDPQNRQRYARAPRVPIARHPALHRKRARTTLLRIAGDAIRVRRAEYRVHRARGRGETSTDGWSDAR